MTCSANINLAENPYKQDFPLLKNQPELAYLDSAATEQRPAAVLRAQSEFYTHSNANPLRGLYELSVLATQAIDETRQKTADFLGASSAEEVIFCRNTTEAINICAQSLGQWLTDTGALGPGDEILISIAEHHSNLIPWQQLARRSGATLSYLYLNSEGAITREAMDAAVSARTKIVACTHISNVLGSKTDIAYFARLCHKQGAYLLVDAAQSAPHLPLSVQELGCDFLAFSAHKLGGPFGVGVLWGKKALLEQMPPVLFGGEMIDSVSISDAVWAPLPEKFEAGTQDGAGIVGLGAALDYLKEKNPTVLFAREQALGRTLFEALSGVPGLKILGSPLADDHHGVVSFNLKGVHPHDVASILDMHKVAIRAGHHCAQPLLTWLGTESCCRASVAFYNDEHDIEQLVSGLMKVKEIFHV